MSLRGRITSAALVTLAVGCSAQVMAWGVADMQLSGQEDPSVTVTARTAQPTVPAGRPETALITVRNTGAPIRNFQLTVTPKGDAGAWTYSHTHVRSSCKVAYNGNWGDDMSCGTLPHGTTTFTLSGIAKEVTTASYQVDPDGHPHSRQAIFLRVTRNAHGVGTTFRGSALS
jgi:hypothetical protein